MNKDIQSIQILKLAIKMFKYYMRYATLLGISMLQKALQHWLKPTSKKHL